VRGEIANDGVRIDLPMQPVSEGLHVRMEIPTHGGLAASIRIPWRNPARRSP
jgi:hypothetical protein